MMKKRKKTIRRKNTTDRHDSCTNTPTVVLSSLNILPQLSGRLRGEQIHQFGNGATFHRAAELDISDTNSTIRSRIDLNHPSKWPIEGLTVLITFNKHDASFLKVWVGSLPFSSKLQLVYIIL